MRVLGASWVCVVRVVSTKQEYTTSFVRVLPGGATWVPPCMVYLWRVTGDLRWSRIGEPLWSKGPGQVVPWRHGETVFPIGEDVLLGQSRTFLRTLSIGIP